jgi:hypothetical protein
MMKSLTLALIVMGICTLGVISGSAQSPFSVNYFANNGVSGAPDATVRVTNPGSVSDLLCAMVYVFDNDQQMDECCGCLETPDGLRTFSVTKDLTSNPLTGVVSKNGDIKILSAVPNAFEILPSECDPTGKLDGIFGALDPVYNLRAWATHIQNKVGTAYPITETAFTDATLSEGELESLGNDCYFVQRLGSGRGVCSCGTGD